MAVKLVRWFFGAIAVRWKVNQNGRKVVLAQLNALCKRFIINKLTTSAVALKSLQNHHKAGRWNYIIQNMKEYKVETLIFYSKLTLDSEHIAKKSKQEIQEKLDEYAKNGYKLTSTSSTSFGAAVYIYLYFEKDL